MFGKKGGKKKRKEGFPLLFPVRREKDDLAISQLTSYCTGRILIFFFLGEERSPPTSSPSIKKRGEGLSTEKENDDLPVYAKEH